jgi:hypothetical protein
MSKSRPVTMLVSYYPKKGRESNLLLLIKKHWAALDREGLVSKMPPQVWRATDKVTRRSYFVEMFQWKDDKASGVAHHTPGAMAIWEPMGAVLERMELVQIEPIRLTYYPER